MSLVPVGRELGHGHARSAEVVAAATEVMTKGRGRLRLGRSRDKVGRRLQPSLWPQPGPWRSCGVSVGRSRGRSCGRGTKVVTAAPISWRRAVAAP